MRVLTLIYLLCLVSCLKKYNGPEIRYVGTKKAPYENITEEGGTPASKHILSNFYGSFTDYQYYFEGLSFNTKTNYVDIRFKLTQEGLDFVDGEGLDITGLVVGDYYTCSMEVTINGDNNNGTITFNLTNEASNLPEMNVCITIDNNCSYGRCLYAVGHTYTRIDSQRVDIDLFNNTSEHLQHEVQ